ncbi:MAG TPA: hypothetical protein VH396_10570 [Chitinophagaceae bacterium]|jgi:hypothetical protein
MKQLISLKQFLFTGLIISAILLNAGCRKDPVPAPEFTSSSTAQDAASSTAGRIYLDLTKDQMIPGGVTNSMLQNYLKHGYKLVSLAADKFAKHVEFKNSEGNIYYKDGWLKKGTTYLMRGKLEPYILMLCSNGEMDFWPIVD